VNTRERLAAMERCPKFEGCNVNICPLDPLMYQCSHIYGEPICRHILDLVEGIPFEFAEEVKASMPVWSKKISKKELSGRIAKRKQVREYFKAKKIPQNGIAAVRHEKINGGGK